MKKLIALFAGLQILLMPSLVSAQSNPNQNHANMRTVTTISWVEQWDPVSERWVRVPDEYGVSIEQKALIATSHVFAADGTTRSETRGDVGMASASYTLHDPQPYGQPSVGTAPRAYGVQYGPFQVIDGKRAALMGTTGANSPDYFAAMLRDFPDLEVLELIEAPGTTHDLANLALGRDIREAGLRTHVPNGGSVRSGAVELFLAGVEQTMEPGAQFAVHSWLDNYGREPDDFAPDAPENRLYLDYYVEMGMSEDRAHHFYAMTNSVPHSGALWLRAEDMAPWISAPQSAPHESARDNGTLVLNIFTGPITNPNLLTRDWVAETFVSRDVTRTAYSGAMPVIDYADLAELSSAWMNILDQRSLQGRLTQG